jgi:hypothetical protein
MMRTTVNLPDEVSDLVRAVAEAKGISLGDAIAELVRRGLTPTAAPRDGAFPSFAVPADAQPITLEQTLAAEDEL